jgi:hypothetical protein
MTSGDSITLPTGPALTYSIGRVDHPPTYYEVPTPAAGSTKPPVVMIHGGAHTGACYLATPDGRQGWGHVFVAQGLATRRCNGWLRLLLVCRINCVH